MKNYILIFIILISTLLFGCSSTKDLVIETDVIFNENTTVNTKFNKEIINNINNTGYDVITLLNENDDSKNILFSPLSLTSALSMLENGASGETKDEILNVLHLKNENNLNETYNSLINHFHHISNNNDENRKSTTINLANSFWFKNNNLKIKESYIGNIKSYYDGDIFSVDFNKSSTKDMMNEWIESKTNNLLKDTIKKTDPLDIAYLINTLYFKGQWLDEFHEHNTKKEDFNINDSERVLVDMMHNQTMRRYFESDEVQIAKLNYSDSAMYVILPKTDINTFIKNHNYKEINEMLDNSAYKEVELYFPKFKFSNNNDLVDLLKELGMKSAFDFKTAEFENMIESNTEVKVSKIFQNTIIEVDEKGTEAAAVTVIEMQTTSAPIQNEIVTMNCNKPFIFILKDNVSKSDLFSGIVRNPNEN